MRSNVDQAAATDGFRIQTAFADKRVDFCSAQPRRFTGFSDATCQSSREGGVFYSCVIGKCRFRTRHRFGDSAPIPTSAAAGGFSSRRGGSVYWDHGQTTKVNLTDIHGASLSHSAALDGQDNLGLADVPSRLGPLAYAVGIAARPNAPTDGQWAEFFDGTMSHRMLLLRHGFKIP